MARNPGEVDPKRLAIWTLERLTTQLREYVHGYYEQMEHSALFLSPREAYTQGKPRHDLLGLSQR
ncbi:MAG TPA: hypothetical protein VFN35_33940 [Ktedonobacteraceae bacterium]|nr:hypothetical protein [Ktedonobacteraceae bacterium]